MVLNCEHSVLEQRMTVRFGPNPEPKKVICWGALEETMEEGNVPASMTDTGMSGPGAFAIDSEKIGSNSCTASAVKNNSVAETPTSPSTPASRVHHGLARGSDFHWMNGLTVTWAVALASLSGITLAPNTRSNSAPAAAFALMPASN